MLANKIISFSSHHTALRREPLTNYTLHQPQFDYMSILLLFSGKIIICRQIKQPFLQHILESSPYMVRTE